MSWIGIKRKFRVKGNRLVCAIQDNNDGQTKINSK